MNPNELRRKKAEILGKAKSINAAAEAEGRTLTDEQIKKVDEYVAEAERLEAEAKGIEAREAESRERQRRIEALEGGDSNRQGSNDDHNRTPGQVKVEAPGFTKDPMKGFASPREYFNAVTKAYDSQGNPLRVKDERLKYLAAAGTDEQQAGSDPYGGFLVPEAMSPNLLQVGAEMNPLMASVTTIAMQSPIVKLNARVDKTHTSSVSGGFTVSRKAETAAATASRGEFEQIKMEATSLFGFAYATEELLRDSPASVASIIEAGFRSEFPSQIFKEMISGTGVGEMEGVLVNPATIAVAKEGGQSADTIVGANILKMRQRAWNFGNSVWVANHDTYIQLNDAHTTLTTDDRPLFSHGNGTDVPDTLLGRPIFFSAYASTLGDLGDIMLLDMSQYLYGLYQPLETAESIHVRFDRNERAFRFSLRNDGKGWWRAALTPVKGANTLSPFVTLAARA